MIDYKEKFWEVMERLYAGAEPEGKSGYVNLVKQKHRYFKEYVKPELEKYIEKRVGKFPDFREELYHKLYTFFDPYFSDSGSMFFVKSYIYYKQYERVYGEEDVKLFWKTKDLYYIKSDILIKSMEVKTEDGITFFFDASNVEHKKNNEKKKLIYSFSHIDPQNRIVLKVEYSEKGKETKEEEIIKNIKKALGIKNFKEEILDKAIQTFERQLKVDYFIHKNPEAFLKQQFNLWISQYFISHEDVELDPNRINQLIALKDVAYKIIEVISKFEEEIKRLWEKPRLVFNSNYVITLDRIAKKEKGIEIIKKLLEHPNIESQIKEWEELGIVGEDFDKKEILNNGVLSQKWQFLPIDTKYFKDLEDEIISLFDLDEELEGLLIKSENFQALNTILPRFREKIQTIYIDPPFNKEQEADYFYEVEYKNSTWATMLENRIRIARECIRDTGSMFVRCDYNGNWIVRPLMDEIFGRENFRNEIVVKRNQALPKTGDVNLIEETDNLFVFSKSEKFCFINQLIEREKSEWVDLGTRPSDLEINPPRIVEGKEFYPPKYRRWAYSQENIDEMYSKGRLKVENGRIKILLDKKKLGSNWTDIPGYSTVPVWGLKTENSEILLKRVIESTSNEGDLVMDFFLGSGTTIAVAHKLKRKWIGIEMGEHFYTVVLPRMKKVLAYDKSGISKEKDVKEKYNEKSAGGFFKYYELEQFEEILRNVEYSQEPASEFFKKYTEVSNITFSQVDPFIFDKRLAKAVKINKETNDWKVDFKELYPDKQVDLIESIVNILGIDYKTAKNLSKEDLLKFYRRVLLCL